MSADPREGLSDYARPFYERLVAAIGVEPAELSEQAGRILCWLAGWDEHTTAGVEELFRVSLARRVAADSGRAAVQVISADPRTCRHCGATDRPLDRGGFCVAFRECLARYRAAHPAKDEAGGEPDARTSRTS